MDLPHRKSNRLKNYDYSQGGAYFITISIKDRLPVLWQDNSDPEIAAKTFRLSTTGMIVEQTICNIPNVYEKVVIDKYCVMPDHLHLVIIIIPEIDGRTVCAPTVSRIVKHLKEAVTKQIGESIWQKSFYDHVIRDERDYQNILTYIEDNPSQWMANPAHQTSE